MKEYSLSATKREVLGKREMKKLRKEDLVPANVYGGEDHINITIKKDDIRNLIYTPDIYLVNLSIDGKERKCIIQELQFHPVTDEVLHIDFLEVFADKLVTIEVPVVLDGFPVGVRAGGKLNLDMRKLKVRGFYKDVPEKLHINVAKLGLGKTMKVGEVSFEGLEVLNAKAAVVAAVRTTRAARSAGVGQAAEEEETEEEASEE